MSEIAREKFNIKGTYEEGFDVSKNIFIGRRLKINLYKQFAIFIKAAAAWILLEIIRLIRKFGFLKGA